MAKKTTSLEQNCLDHIFEEANLKGIDLKTYNYGLYQPENIDLLMVLEDCLTDYQELEVLINSQKKTWEILSYDEDELLLIDEEAKKYSIRDSYFPTDNIRTWETSEDSITFHFKLH